MAGEARYLVGVDLGTVNSALAAVDLAREGDLASAVEAFPIPQLVAPGEVRERRLLPSCAYLPGPELAVEATRLPWGERPVVVGELAREQGARVPGRLVTSAKSWLANPRADRTAPILPWGAPDGVPRLSPVAGLGAPTSPTCERRGITAHPGAPLAEQELVLAVPASFDEVARELTLAAARDAGLGRVTLIEEPSAAFHDWASRHRAALAAAGAGEVADEVRPIARGGIVLVVDVGGGTTDLTLVRAELREGRPAFTRLAVGDHLLLGGDNVDLALARAVEAPRSASGSTRAASPSLVHACRLAKERLMAEGAPERLPIAVVGRGSRLVATALSTEVTREEVRRVFLDGFFPPSAADERPRRAPRTAGLAELGLPYEPEPAIPRHVAAFLAAHAAEAGRFGRARAARRDPRERRGVHAARGARAARRDRLGLVPRRASGGGAREPRARPRRRARRRVRGPRPPRHRPADRRRQPARVLRGDRRAGGRARALRRPAPPGGGDARRGARGRSRSRSGGRSGSRCSPRRGRASSGRATWSSSPTTSWRCRRSRRCSARTAPRRARCRSGSRRRSPRSARSSSGARRPIATRAGSSSSRCAASGRPRAAPRTRAPRWGRRRAGSRRRARRWSSSSARRRRSSGRR